MELFPAIQRLEESSITRTINDLVDAVNRLRAEVGALRRTKSDIGTVPALAAVPTQQAMSGGLALPAETGQDGMLERVAALSARVEALPPAEDFVRMEAMLARLNDIVASSGDVAELRAELAATRLEQVEAGGVALLREEVAAAKALALDAFHTEASLEFEAKGDKGAKEEEKPEEALGLDPRLQGLLGHWQGRDGSSYHITEDTASSLTVATTRRNGEMRTTRGLISTTFDGLVRWGKNGQYILADRGTTDGAMWCAAEGHTSHEVPKKAFDWCRIDGPSGGDQQPLKIEAQSRRRRGR